MTSGFLFQNLRSLPAGGLTGRRRILTSVREITAANVADVLRKANATQMQNAGEITYLLDYYKGRQDIRLKEKLVREQINNKVTVNRANEIVTFKTAYLLNEPIQYISRGDEKQTSERINRLNEFMRAEDKESKDKEIVDWLHICGIAERMCLTDEMAGVQDGAPFYIYTLDPRTAYVIRSNRIGNRPMAGVILQQDENDEWYADVYTETRIFTVKDDAVEENINWLGMIPVVEYENNFARMGAFENVIPILNAINEIESDAVDSIQDFVNGFDVFQNCDIDDGTYGQLAIGGKAVKIKTVVQGMEAKVYRVSSEISQSGVQQRIDDLTDSYLTICGMPNRNGGSSTSDTGQAVIFRDGWSEAESRAKDSEKLFIRSERDFLRIVLSICGRKTSEKFTLDGLELKDIGVNFARKSLNNLQSRFQCMCEGLANDFMHPMDVFNAFGDMFGDKNAAYRRGMEWHEQQQALEEEALQAQLDAERERISGNGGEESDTGTVQGGGQNDSKPEPENPGAAE